MKFATLVLPQLFLNFMVEDVMRKGMKICYTNINGPERHLEFGGCKTKKVMFINYFKQAYIQMSVFSHCGTIRIGVNVGQ